MEESLILDKTRVKNYIPEIKRPYEQMVDGNLIRCGIIFVNPELAGLLLKHHNKNRKLTKANLSFIDNQMRNEWVFDGEPLRFDTNLDLIDGRHRLTVLSKMEGQVSYPFLVVMGLKPESFKVMDTGKKRSGGDTLSVEGYDESFTTAAAIRLVHAVENGNLTEPRVASKGGLSNTQISEQVSKHPDLIPAVKDAKEWNKKNKGNARLMSHPTAAAFLYLFRQKDVQEANVFMKMVLKGVDLKENSPAYALRHKLHNATRTTAGTYIPFRLRNAYTIHAWNKYRNNETVSHLKLPSDLSQLTIK